MSEHALQAGIIAYLDRVLPPGIRAVGVSNNPRSAVAGAKEKARGMRKGFPDILLTGNFHGLLEVKTTTGRLSPEQREWRDWAAERQVPYAVVRGIGDVEAALLDWGINLKGRLAA